MARLPPRRRRRLGLVVLVVLFALFLFLSNLVQLAAEWLWFQALGYERVFTTRLVGEAVLGVAVGGLVFAFLHVNLRIAQRGLVPNPLVVQFSSGAAAVDVTRLSRRLALPTALGLALLFGMGAAGGWLGVLQFLHRMPFGVTDPVFGRDVGYYVFTVPVIAGAIGLVIAVTRADARGRLLAPSLSSLLRRRVVWAQQTRHEGPRTASPRRAYKSCQNLLFRALCRQVCRSGSAWTRGASPSGRTAPHDPPQGDARPTAAPQRPSTVT